MKKLQLLVTLALCFAVNLQAQTITTGTVSPTTLCVGAIISLPYTITGTFNDGNVFTAQLSNSIGSFTTPAAIGTLTSTAGTTAATLLSSTVAGMLYIIRGVSNTPAITVTSNPSNISINALPTAPVITSTATSVCAGSPVTLTATASRNTWTQQIYNPQ